MSMTISLIIVGIVAAILIRFAFKKGFEYGELSGWAKGLAQRE